MIEAYYSGLSGLMSYQSGLDVVSDNIANINTVGFRGSSTEFSDLFSTALINAGSVTSDETGLGSRLSGTTMQTQSGSLYSTDRFLDLAIGGDGWFQVVSGADTYYTRAGNFVLDSVQATAGDANSSIARIVTTDGQFLSGTMLTNFAYDGTFDYGDGGGAFVLNNPTDSVTYAAANQQTTMELPTRLAYPVEPSTLATFTGNLGSEDTTRSISADIVSPNNDINRLKLTFTQSAVQPDSGIAWDVTATVTSNDGSVVYDTQSGQAIFDASGGLSSFSIPSVNNDGATVQIELGSGFSGLVALDNSDFYGSATSDGVSGGVLTQYGIDENGNVIAEFSNGRQSAIGRIALYHFQNEQGLLREGGTLFSESANSGAATFWTDADGNTITGATLYSSKLENSNVELSVGLTDMIIMQRAYQANAKTVTTADELLQKALQMHK